MRNNRTAGNKAELYFKSKLEELHEQKLYSTREISRLSDAKKIDIENENLNLEIKYQVKQSINTPKFSEIINEMKSNYNEPCLILYQKTKKAKVNFCKVDDYVIMTFEDYEKIMKEYLKKK